MEKKPKIHSIAFNVSHWNNFVLFFVIFLQKELLSFFSIVYFILLLKQTVGAIVILQQEPIKCFVLFVWFERHGMTKMKWSNYAFFCFYFSPSMMTTFRWVDVGMRTFVTFNCMNVNLISSDIFSIKKLKHLLVFSLLSSILLLLLLLISIYTNCPYLIFSSFLPLTKKKFSVWFNTFVFHDNGNRFLVLRFLLQNIFFFFKRMIFEIRVMWVL